MRMPWRNAAAWVVVLAHAARGRVCDVDPTDSWFSSSMRALRHLREDELRAVPAIAAGDVSALLTCIHDKLGHHEEF